MSNLDGNSRADPESAAWECLRMPKKELEAVAGDEEAWAEFVP